VGTNSTNAALKYLMKKLPYDQDTAFTPVGFLGSVPLMVAVNNDVPAKTLKELVDLARAKPGQVSFGLRQHLAAGVVGDAGQHGRRAA
jgi:tripartite-type tricarboxylate transporter receptor subunit TctC